MNWQTYSNQQKIDVSIVESRSLNYGTRLDSLHYSEKYLSALELIKRKKTDRLIQFQNKPVTTGHTPSMAEDSFWNGNIPFIKTDNLREDFIKDDFNDFLTEIGSKKLASSKLKKGDVIVTIIGATQEIIGRATMVPVRYEGAHINQNIALIRPSKYPEYLSVLLNSKYGRLQLEYLSRQTEQVNLNCREIEELLVPIPGHYFASLIAKIYNTRHELLEESKRKLEQAEEKLQKALGIDQSRLSTKNHSSKSLTDVLKENRLDAEYWMPKYDRLLERIDKFETATLDTFFKKPIKGIEVGSNEYAEDGMPFVRVSDFSVFGVEKFISKKISQELYQKLKDDYSPNKGELLFTKDGTIGITCVIEDKIEAIISGAFLRLRPKTQVDPHYLALIMNSFICKMQIERLSGGALIAHFKPDDLNKILVPYVGEGIQLVIGDEVRNALALRKKSQQLIDTAKHSIEIFIEQDEKSAIALLKKML